MNNIRQDHEALFSAFAYESVTVDNTTGGVRFTKLTHTPAAGNPAKRAIVTVETAQIRYKIDGGAPTSSEGHILNVNDVLSINGQGNINNFRAIRVGSTSGVIKCTFER